MEYKKYMFTIKNLKKIIKHLPDDMPFGMVDIGTDDYNLSNYDVKESSFSTEEYSLYEGDIEKRGYMLILTFNNKRAEDILI